MAIEREEVDQQQRDDANHWVGFQETLDHSGQSLIPKRRKAVSSSG